MPSNKDLKRLIRNRMEKTGESYTAARARILEKNTPPVAQFAALAGMSDAAVVDKSMRITWPDRTSVHLYFTAKAPRKSQVAIQHTGLGAKKDVAATKDYWAERLAALGEILVPARSIRS